MPCTPCDERCPVQCTYCNVKVLYVVTTLTAIRLACSVSNMTRLLHVHMVPALYRILTGSFTRLILYGLSLLVRTRNALQNELTINGTLQCRVHVHICLMLFLETDSNSSCRLTVYLANSYGSVITCTMVDGKPSVLTL